MHNWLMSDDKHPLCGAALQLPTILVQRGRKTPRVRLAALTVIARNLLVSAAVAPVRSQGAVQPFSQEQSRASPRS